MGPLFEVWQSPGGKRWEGHDQEEAILAALQSRCFGTVTELAEILGPDGRFHLRCLAAFDDRIRTNPSA